MLAFYCVLFRDQNGARLVELELVESDVGMILEWVRFDVEVGVAQEVEKSLRIANAGDCVHGFVAKRLERALRAVFQMIDLRDDGFGAKHAGMAPAGAVDDD